MLETLLHQQITQQGPIRLDEFINQALYHEAYGYYRTRTPIGKENDFITSPEICSVFGEMIGLFLLDYWQKSECPTPIRLVELGPGSGTMMADILKSFRLRPAIFNNLTVHLVELSEPLKKCQQENLQAYPFVTWHQHLDEIPDGFTFVVGNEFFDALLKLPQLESIIVSISAVTGENLTAPVNTTLKHLHFGVVGSLKYSSLKNIVKLCPNLVSLKANYMRDFSAAQGKKIHKRLPKLKFASLQNAKFVPVLEIGDKNAIPPHLTNIFSK